MLHTQYWTRCCPDWTPNARTKLSWMPLWSLFLRTSIIYEFYCVANNNTLWTIQYHAKQILQILVKIYLSPCSYHSRIYFHEIINNTHLCNNNGHVYYFCVLHLCDMNSDVLICKQETALEIHRFPQQYISRVIICDIVIARITSNTANLTVTCSQNSS